jgi:hypothetical protein
VAPCPFLNFLSTHPHLDYVAQKEWHAQASPNTSFGKLASCALGRWGSLIEISRTKVEGRNPVSATLYMAPVAYLGRICANEFIRVLTRSKAVLQLSKISSLVVS